MREVNVFILVTVSFWLYTVDKTSPLGKISERWNDLKSKDVGQRLYLNEL